MDTALYYFTGTGNSLYTAKCIAEKTGGKLIPIASQVDKYVVTTDADVLGIIFPVYCGDLPVIVKEFAGKLENLQQKYLFAVCTYGGAASNSLRRLKEIIRSRGGELSASYGIHMPQNSFSKPFEDRQKLYRQCREKADLIAINIQAGEKAEFTSRFLNSIVLLFQSKMESGYRKQFVKLSNASPELHMDELTHLTDRSFTVTADCNGCGICARVCPVHNIVMENHRPVWLHRCETCSACYNWCPNRAIRGGVTTEGYFYRHPDISISEMIKQAGSL